MVTLTAPTADEPTLTRDGVWAVTDRWALLLRTTAGAGSGLVGLLTPGPVAGVPVLAVLLGWSLFRLLGRTEPNDRRLLPVDLVVTLGVALATPVLVESAVEARSLASMPAAVVAAAGVTFVWQLRGWRVLAWVVAAVAALALGGALAGAAPQDLLVVWYLPIQSFVVWLMMVVLRRGAARADREAVGLVETRTAAVLAAQRRVAEREHWAVLHDTAAATLLVVGTGVPGTASARVRAQAGRDLRALEAAAPGRDDPTRAPTQPDGTTLALTAALRPLLGEGPLRAELDGPDDVAAPAGVVAALRDATRELLTNVERHAGTAHARVRVGRDAGTDGVWVEVRDRGTGFDAGAVEGRGLRESVRGRVSRVGGTVALRTTPGGGTTVRLRWAPPVAGGRAAPPPTSSHSVVGELVRGFRLVLLGVVVVSAAFRVLTAHAADPGYDALETAYLAVAAGVVVLVAWAALRRRPVAPAATALAAVAAVLDAVVAVRLGPSGIGGVADWTSQSVGWLWFFTLGVRRRGPVLALLCAPFLLRAGVLLLDGDLGALRLVGVFGLGLVVLQMGGGLFLGALEAQAARAERLRDARLAVEAARSVADGLLEDFRTRSRALRATTVPLLRELADGTASPTDETTRHRARIEGARLRRLFAEADALDASLSAEVRSVVEQVERGGVSTSLEVEATPPLDTDVRRALLDEPMATLALARTRARVVVQLVAGEVVVSVTTDGPPPPTPPAGDHRGVTTLRAAVDGRTWAQSSWALPPAADPVGPAAPAGARTTAGSRA
ncbi:sensor histidine kinase [Rhodococcus aerolatus]